MTVLLGYRERSDLDLLSELNLNPRPQDRGMARHDEEAARSAFEVRRAYHVHGYAAGQHQLNVNATTCSTLEIGTRSRGRRALALD
jgi:hypothetical protein